jgi:hypothetical protein
LPIASPTLLLRQTVDTSHRYYPCLRTDHARHANISFANISYVLYFISSLNPRAAARIDDASLLLAQVCLLQLAPSLHVTSLSPHAFACCLPHAYNLMFCLFRALWCVTPPRSSTGCTLQFYYPVSPPPLPLLNHIRVDCPHRPCNQAHGPL